MQTINRSREILVAVGCASTHLGRVGLRDCPPSTRCRWRTQSAQSGMAGKGGPRGEVVLFGQFEVDFVRRRMRDAQIPRWATGLISVHQLPDESHFSSGTTTSPGSCSFVACDSLSLSQPVPADVAVLSTSLSSVGLCCCWDVGTQRVPSRECGCKNLSRGRWEDAN